MAETGTVSPGRVGTVQGSRVREIRKRLGYTQRRLVARVKFIGGQFATEDYIKRLEADRAGDIGTSKAVAIAAALGVTVEELVGPPMKLAV